jgi:hypothetical protein
MLNGNTRMTFYKNQPKFIKFAFEKCKTSQLNINPTRFPQTRMGVEQVFTDYFQTYR